jgi:hypothetical protein
MTIAITLNAYWFLLLREKTSDGPWFRKSARLMPASKNPSACKQRDKLGSFGGMHDRPSLALLPLREKTADRTVPAGDCAAFIAMKTQ